MYSYYKDFIIVVDRESRRMTYKARKFSKLIIIPCLLSVWLLSCLRIVIEMTLLGTRECHREKFGNLVDVYDRWRG